MNKQLSWIRNTIWLIVAMIVTMSLVNCSIVAASTSNIAQEADVKAVQNFPTFEQYVKDFDKKYEKGSEEYLKREIIYNQRIEKLKQMQKDPKIQYRVGVNQFSDQTDQERQKRKPLAIDQKSRETQKQNPKKVSQATGTIPLNLDWRKSNIITSVKDQGACGACWTFATAAYGESRLVKNGSHTLSIDLSEQYLLSCTAQCSCQGGYLEYVFEKAAGGVPLETEYPYSPNMPNSPFICWSGSKINFGYIPQKHYDLSDTDMKNLLQAGPVAISISATNWQDYSGGVFKCNSFDKVNHAVLLVGYTPSYWIIKNQWGLKWGEQGYIRVSSDPLYNCKIGTSAFVMWQKVFIFTIYLISVLFILI